MRVVHPLNLELLLSGTGKRRQNDYQGKWAKPVLLKEAPSPPTLKHCEPNTHFLSLGSRRPPAADFSEDHVGSCRETNTTTLLIRGPLIPRSEEARTKRARKSTTKGGEAPPGTVRAGPRAWGEAGDKGVMWLGQGIGPKTFTSVLPVLINLPPTAQESTTESAGPRGQRRPSLHPAPAQWPQAGHTFRGQGQVSPLRPTPAPSTLLQLGFQRAREGGCRAVRNGATKAGAVKA